MLLIVCPPVIKVARLNVSPASIPAVAAWVFVIKKSFLAVLNADPYLAVAADVTVTVTLLPPPLVLDTLAAELITTLAYATPPIVTVGVPVKFVPVIVITEPTTALVGVKDVIVGVGKGVKTVKLAPVVGGVVVKAAL